MTDLVFQELPDLDVLAKARAEAASVRTNAEVDAARIRARAQQDADTIRRNAQRDAQHTNQRPAATANRTAEKGRRLDALAARAVIIGTVGLTASGEYALALMVGFWPGVAWLLPFVIDAYVIQAFRRHRDVPQAIGLTIATNVVYHLAAVGLFGLTPSGRPEWWLVATVASIASLILWRIHRMIAPQRERREHAETARETPAETSRETPVPVSAETAETSHETPGESTRESSRETPAALAESAAETSRETPAESPAERSQPKRSHQPKPKVKKRESSSRETPRKVAPIGDIEREIRALIALMEERGGADEVKLSDAERITGKATATAARRLSTARDRYRNAA